MVRHFVLTTLIVISVATYSFGDVVVNEAFDYTVGSQIGGQNGGTGFTGAWSTPDEGRIDSEILAGSLSAPVSLPAASGNSLSFIDDPASGLSGSRAQRGVGTFNSGTVYISFLLDMNDFSSAAGSGFELGFAGDNDIMAVGADGSGDFGLIGKDGRGSIAIAESTMEQLNHFVMRISYGAGSPDNLTLFLNPIIGSEVDNAGAIVGSVDANWDFDRIGVLNFQNAPGFMIDEITIATEFGDVVSAVPEPTSGVLFVAVGGLCVWRRRR